MWLGRAFHVASVTMVRGAALVEGDVQLGLHHRTAAAGVLEYAERPAPSQPQADAILALGKVRGDVVRQVEPALAVVRDRRAEHIVAHLPAIHVQFVISQSADVDRGRGGDLLQCDGFAQPGERTLVVRHPVRADPIARPVGCRERSHTERCRRAPRRRRAGLIPHADLPPAARTLGQRRAGVRYPLRLIRCDLARVPQRPLVGCQRSGRVGHQQLVRRLCQTADPRRNRPGKSRLRPIDTQGVDQSLTKQPLRRTGLRSPSR